LIIALHLALKQIDEEARNLPILITSRLIVALINMRLNAAMIDRSIGCMISPVNMVSFYRMIHCEFSCFKDDRHYQLE